MASTTRFTGRQIIVMVAAVLGPLVLGPVAALAAVASFSSSSASTPAVSATNTSSGAGAKAVYGNASATSGAVYAVYGHTGSTSGYGVYSAGRLGSSGLLVCGHCVTGGDVNAASFPTVPSASNANGLGGHAPSYYARIVPLATNVPSDTVCCPLHLLADLDGLHVLGDCVVGQEGGPIVSFWLAADSDSAAGVVNWFYNLSTTNATYPAATGTVLGTTPVQLASGGYNAHVEGAAVYKNTGTGRIITINFHLFANTCELFGDMITTG